MATVGFLNESGKFELSLTNCAELTCSFLGYKRKRPQNFIDNVKIHLHKVSRLIRITNPLTKYLPAIVP